MEEENYRNIVILLLCILIGLYIYDLSYTRSNIPKNIEKITPIQKTTKKNNICDKNICIIDKKTKKKYKKEEEEEEEIKRIGDIDNNSLDDIESVVKKISNI